MSKGSRSLSHSLHVNKTGKIVRTKLQGTKISFQNVLSIQLGRPLLFILAKRVSLGSSISENEGKSLQLYRVSWNCFWTAYSKKTLRTEILGKRDKIKSFYICQNALSSGLDDVLVFLRSISVDVEGISSIVAEVDADRSCPFKNETRPKSDQDVAVESRTLGLAVVDAMVNRFG